MFLSLFIIITFGILGGIVFEKIKIPKIIWYIILGIILSPSGTNIADPLLLNISPYLRQIALVIILTRSGLALDTKTLRKIGTKAILLSFLPATFEIIGITIFAPLLLGISYLEALLLGSVLAAVSPAIVVPRMLKLIDEGYNDIPKLIMAGSSIDDIFVIVLFYSFKELNLNNSFNAISLLQIPTSIILGVVLGILVSTILIVLFRYLKLNSIYKTMFILFISLGLIYLENSIKQYLSISALIAIIAMSIILSKKDNTNIKEVKQNYNTLWSFFEILLFTLVGLEIDVTYLFSTNSFVILGLIIIGLVFRSIGVIFSLIKSKYNLKEKLFIVLSYLPKATVQASIGAIALNEGLACGTLILTSAILAIVFTAPLGAILIDNTYPHLIKKDMSKFDISLIN